MAVNTVPRVPSADIEVPAGAPLLWDPGPRDTIDGALDQQARLEKPGRGFSPTVKKNSGGNSVGLPSG